MPPRQRQPMCLEVTFFGGNSDNAVDSSGSARAIRLAHHYICEILLADFVGAIDPDTRTVIANLCQRVSEILTGQYFKKTPILLVI
jgi:hypothetical protein